MSHKIYAANGKVSHIYQCMCKLDYTIDKSLVFILISYFQIKAKEGRHVRIKIRYLLNLFFTFVFLGDTLTYNNDRWGHARYHSFIFDQSYSKHLIIIDQSDNLHQRVFVSNNEDSPSDLSVGNKNPEMTPNGMSGTAVSSSRKTVRQDNLTQTYQNQAYYRLCSLRELLGTPRVFMGFVLPIFLVFCCVCVFFCFVCLPYASCMPNAACVSELSIHCYRFSFLKRLFTLTLQPFTSLIHLSML